MENPKTEPKIEIKTETVVTEKTSKMGRVMTYVFYTLFILLFLWVISQLFFQEELILLQEKAHQLIGVQQTQKAGVEDLRIIYPNEPAMLDPRDIDPTARQRLVNIFEPLVKFDAFYNLRPSLALSWGLIDEYTWEFALRPGVKFHDGTNFDAEDVRSSIEGTHALEIYEFSNIVDSIEEVDIIDELTLQIKTSYPDPLLLQKLALLLIHSEENTEIQNPIGTGSYEYKSWEDGVMTFERFDDYWGEKANFQNVELYTIPNKSDRVNALLQGDADFLAFVSYDAVEIVRDLGFRVTTIPTLEVQVLMFNFASEILSDLKARKLISLVVNQKDLVEQVGGYAIPINQFVSNGIFGFEPNIAEHEFDLEKARDLAESLGLVGETLQFHLPLGLDILGEHIRENLKEIGIFVIVSYMEIPDFIESIDSGIADIYFMGFKSELGDASEFLTSTVHSEGEYNTFSFENSNVDYLIDEAMIEFDPAKRRDALQESMQIVVEEEIVGVPLFEYETVNSYVNSLNYSPRIDGLIYFDDITPTLK